MVIVGIIVLYPLQCQVNGMQIYNQKFRQAAAAKQKAEQERAERQRIAQEAEAKRKADRPVPKTRLVARKAP